MTKNLRIAATIWGVSILLSRVIGMLREAVLGRVLGAGAEADAYNASFQIPDFLNYLLAAGALSIVFIPIFGAHLARGEEERGWEAFSVIASFLAVLLGVLTVALFFLAPLIAPWIVPGFTPAQLDEFVLLTRIVLPAQIFHVLGGLLAAALQARHRHTLSALAPLVYTGAIVIGGLCGDPAHGARGFAWGALVGSALGPFGLPLAGCLWHGLAWRWKWNLRHPDLRTYLVRSLPIMLGFSIVVVDDWYLRHYGSLLGTGELTVLNYAKTLMRVPVGVFGFAAGVAAFPLLSQLVAEGKREEMHATLVPLLRRVLLLAFTAQAVLTVSGTEIATLIYGRTRMSPAQLEELGACLAWISLGIGAWSAQTLLARGFHALGNTWLPALLGTLVALAALPLYMLGRTHFGTQGLAIASSTAIVIYAVLLAWLLGRSVHATTSSLVPLLARALPALGLAIGAGVLLRSVMPEGVSIASLLLRLCACGGGSALVFLACARMLGLREIGSMAEPWLR